MNFIVDGKPFQVTEAPLFEVSGLSDVITSFPAIFLLSLEVNYALLKTTQGSHLFVTTMDDETHIEVVKDLAAFKFPSVIYDEPSFIKFLTKNNLTHTNLNYMLIDDHLPEISCFELSNEHRIFSNLPCYGHGSFQDGEDVIYVALFNLETDVWVVTNGLSQDGKLNLFSIEKKLVKKLIFGMPCGHLQPDNLKEILKRIGFVTFEQRHGDSEEVILGNIKKHPNNPLIIGNAKLYAPIILEKEVTIKTSIPETTYKCAYFEDRPNVMSVAIFEMVDGDFKMIYTDELTDWTPKHLQHIAPIKHGLVLTQTLPDLFEKLSLPPVNEYFGYIPTYSLGDHIGEHPKVETFLGKYKTTSKVLGVIEVSKNKSLVVLDHPTQANGFKPIVFKMNNKKGKLKPSSLKEMVQVINHYSHLELPSHKQLFENLGCTGFFET